MITEVANVRDIMRWVRTRALGPLRARLNAMISRAVVSIVDDSTGAQQLQVRVLKREVLDDVEHVQPAGVSFVPVEGAEAVLLCLGGSRDYPVAICPQKRGDRPADLGLEPGEGGLFYAGEYKVFVAADGTVHLGEKDPSDWVALASQVDAEIQRLWDVLTTWTVAPNDGGGALQTAANAQVTAVQSVASDKARVG